ncbi:MAG: tRNA-dihydrouridine synthase family protein, partial [Spirochaetota bacterium]
TFPSLFPYHRRSMKQNLPARALLLAPMVALSHRALRELILGFGGMDLAFTEMASAAAIVAHTKYDEWYIDAAPSPERVIYQFYTIRPESLPEAMAIVAGRGAFGADINFGCSAPHITRAGGGAAWMREPERGFALTRLARAAWPASLSAKLRIGADDDYERLRDFCLGLCDAGLDFLTLHPRLEGQKFRRKVRWDYVSRLATDLPRPVVGNGDIEGWADYSRRMSGDGPAGIMIGREAVRRPWIFALLRGLEADAAFELRIDLREVANRFLDLVETRLPPDFHESRAKRFFFYFSDNFSYDHHIRVRLNNAPDLSTMRRLLDEYLVEVPGDRFRVDKGG